MSGNSIKSGLIWNTVQQFGLLGFSLISILVLARLLSPTDYGIFAILSIFIQIANTLVDSGLGGYVIKKQNAEPIQFSTLFVYNLVASIILYLIIFFSAPFIAELYESPIVESAIRVVGITVLIQAFSIVQFSYLYKDLKFKELAIVSLLSGMVGLIVAITLGYKGYGVWALIYQQVISSVMTVLLYLLYNRTWPGLKFDYKVFKEQFSFGINLLLSTVIDTIRNNITNNFVGKTFTLKAAGYFVQGQHMQSYPANMALNVINRTFYPILSKHNENIEEYRAQSSSIRKKMYAYLFPCFALLIIYAEYIIQLVLGDKWMPAVPFFIILLVGVFPQIIIAINRTILKALGFTRDILIINTVALVVLIGLLSVSTLFKNVYLMPIMLVLTQFMALGISFYYQKKRVAFTYREQLMEMAKVLPVVIIPIAIKYLFVSNIALQIVMPIVAMVAIIGAYIYFGETEYKSLYNVVKQRLTRK